MTPVLYVSDLQSSDFDPADLFDLAYLLRAPGYDLRGVCLRDDGEGGERVVAALCLAANKPMPPIYCGSDDLLHALEDAPEPVNLVVVGGYGVPAAVLQSHQPLFRQKVARLFLVGGHVNQYAAAEPKNDVVRLPIDPRLRQRFPQRFVSTGEPRINQTATKAEWSSLLSSGEGVIWLPRDVCVFRYAAPGVLQGGGPLCDFLLRELFWANLPHFPHDRYAAADAPVLLSALPALLLATQPDPFGWMRLFRTTTARAEVGGDHQISTFSTQTNAPNLYAVTAIDGQALGKRLTDALRDTPLTV